MKLLVLILLPFLALAAAAMMDMVNGFAKKPNDPTRFPVSIISPDEANDLFKDFAKDKDIPFRYPVDGCFARATEMSRIAATKNITMGRIYFEGSLNVLTPLKEYPGVHWGWHVAPVAYVKQPDGSNKVMIFDPSLFDHPVSVKEMQNRLLTKIPGWKDPYIKETYFGDRYQYWPRNEEANRTDWDVNVLKSVKEKFALFSPRQDLGDGAPASAAAKTISPGSTQ